MKRFLTIGALVDACAPRDADKRSLWTMRAEHWTTQGKVLPEPTGPRPAHRAARTGRGRQRRYREADAYLMAIIFRLSDMLSINALNAVSEKIQAGFVEYADWEDARLGTDQDFFLQISMITDREACVVLHRGSSTINDIHPDLERNDDPLILINASAIFEQVRRATIGGENED
jgi:hypothetical protein